MVLLDAPDVNGDTYVHTHTVFPHAVHVHESDTCCNVEAVHKPRFGPQANPIRIMYNHPCQVSEPMILASFFVVAPVEWPVQQQSPPQVDSEKCEGPEDTTPKALEPV